VRYYHPIPIPLPNHTMAYRLQATLRSNDGGTYHRVVAGGESSVRGYSSGTFGLRCNANNKVVFNAEYRAQLLESPPIWVPPLATVYTKQATLRHRFDAALFFDGALLWNDILTNPLRRTHDYEREYGYSFGFGLRWMVPTMKRTFCFDFIPLTKSLDDGIENNDPHFNDGPLRFHWPFYYNFYLDFNF
jgi:outer membrane protein assembly factor BamA